MASVAPTRRVSRVVLWGTCDMSKPRVRILRDGLRQNGIEVIECRKDVWGDIQDKSQIKGAGRWLLLLTRIVAAYPALIVRYLRLPTHDWVLLGYPAIPDIFVIRLLAWLRRTPVALDWFLSAYDTVVLDRRLVGKRHPLAWILWLAEALAVRLADQLFMDTRAHAVRMESLFRLAPGRCGTVWVGVEEQRFSAPTEAVARSADEPLQVLFYGQFIPLHGMPTIIEAARLLRHEPVEWLIIGRGQERARVEAMLKADPLPRLRTLDWVDYEDLLGYLRAADICLGIFGTSDKAASVIPNKVFQVLAAGKPLITRDSPAIREIVEHAPPAVTLVPAGSPASLSAAILQWRPQQLRYGATPTSMRPFTTSAIGRQLAELLATGSKPTGHQQHDR